MQTSFTEFASFAERFPVRRIYCVGRNYVDHAIEMGHSGREPPFFFMKPADAILPVTEDQIGQMRYPSLTRDLHHEVELVVKDHGRGMTPRERRKAFTPGFTTKRRGWGLGLALARRVVREYHRGRISIVESTPGRGTTVAVALPVAPSPT